MSRKPTSALRRALIALDRWGHHWTGELFTTVMGFGLGYLLYMMGYGMGYE